MSIIILLSYLQEITTWFKFYPLRILPLKSLKLKIPVNDNRLCIYTYRPVSDSSLNTFLFIGEKFNKTNLPQININYL